jgi:hypothetical protein
MVRSMDELQAAVRRLIKLHKGVRAAGRATGLDPGYLVRLRDGEKLNPGEEVLQKLGLQRRFTAVKELVR